jgi:hypothetical protein
VPSERRSVKTIFDEAAEIVGNPIGKTASSGLSDGTDTVCFFEYDSSASFDTLGPRNVSHS